MFSERNDIIDRYKTEIQMSPLDECRPSPDSADSCDASIADMMQQRIAHSPVSNGRPMLILKAKKKRVY